MMRNIVPRGCGVVAAVMLAVPAMSAAAAGSVPTARIDTGILSGIHNAKRGLGGTWSMPAQHADNNPRLHTGPSVTW